MKNMSHKLWPEGEMRDNGELQIGILGHASLVKCVTHCETACMCLLGYLIVISYSSYLDGFLSTSSLCPWAGPGNVPKSASFICSLDFDSVTRSLDCNNIWSWFIRASYLGPWCKCCEYPNWLWPRSLSFSYCCCSHPHCIPLLGFTWAVNHRIGITAKSVVKAVNKSTYCICYCIIIFLYFVYFCIACSLISVTTVSLIYWLALCL